MAIGLISRRQFGVAGLAFCGTRLFASTVANAAPLTLPPWSPGELDIHHIDTGRGNATFILAPDGTTALIDCGSNHDPSDAVAPARPDGSRAPGEWVARYALRQARAADRTSLDYMVATHVHGDHIGDVTAEQLRAANGEFVRTGLSQVDQLMPAATMIDRSYPDYGLLKPLNAPFVKNYLAWLDQRVRSGKAVQRAEVGSTTQIALRTPDKFPAFSARVLSANGRVWSGSGTTSRSVFPDLTTLPADELPEENYCSIALRIGYGNFSYYTGGDLSADTHDGREPWRDVERAVVEACGRVEVAVADHHAYFDACGPAFVRSLDAQAYIIPAWHMTHPGQAQLQRLVGAWPGVQQRDVFATEMLPANRILNERWVKQMRSTQGHVVIRVARGGDSYKIFVLDSSIEEVPVTLACGPYVTRSSRS